MPVVYSPKLGRECGHQFKNFECECLLLLLGGNSKIFRRNCDGIGKGAFDLHRKRVITYFLISASKNGTKRLVFFP